MRGGDETKVGLLRRSAKALGFRVYLAQITLTKEGRAEDCSCAEEVDERNSERESRREEGSYCHYGRRRGRGRWGGYGYDDDEDDEDEDEDVEVVCECSREIEPDSEDRRCGNYVRADPDAKTNSL